MKSKFLPHIALLVANCLYAANYTVAKWVMPDYILPFGFIFARVLGAVTFFWLIHLVFNREKIAKSDIPRLIACGLFGVAINQLAFFKGLDLTTPVNASLIMITTPILVFLIAVIARKEKLHWYKIVGIVLGSAGAIYTMVGKQFSFSSLTAMGDLLVLLNATSYGIYLTIVKPLMSKYQPVTVITWVFTFGFIPVFFIALPEFRVIEWSTFPTGIIVATLFVVFGVTCGAYLCNMFALSKVNPSVVGIYIYLQPILATLVAIYFKADQLTMEKMIAALFIFAGVYFVSFYQPKQKIAL